LGITYIDILESVKICQWFCWVDFCETFTKKDSFTIARLSCKHLWVQKFTVSITEF